MTTEHDWLAGGNRQDLARRAVHAAAWDVLVERGLDRFTAEAVARRAGCSRATLYRVAGGKKALLAAVLGTAAGEVATRVTAQVAGLHGEDRVVEAILIALEEIRADEQVHDWVRRAVTTEYYTRDAGVFAEIATAWVDAEGARPLAGQWILRVVLMLLVSPGSDADVERELVRSFVGPAFRA